MYLELYDIILMFPYAHSITLQIQCNNISVTGTETNNELLSPKFPTPFSQFYL